MPNGARGKIPSLSELQQFNVNRPGAVEAVRQTLYDFQVYALAGQTQLNFFQVPVGQAGKTQADTNMETAGTLPAPKQFLAQSIEVVFFSSVALAMFGAQAIALGMNDVQAVHQGGWLDFFIGSKSYLLEAPIGKFPPKTYIKVNAALSDATTPAPAFQSRIAYAVSGGRPYYLEPPILLVPTQNFRISLNWPVAVALPSGANGRIGIVLDGILYRNSQ